MTVLLAELQDTLPNFPVEVLEEWLLPYARLEGWPPAPTLTAELKGRWRYLLRKQPLSYWAAMRWSKVERHVSIHDLDPEYQKIMVQMALGTIKGQKNLCSSSIKDLHPRFMRIVQHFAETGIFPKVPALLYDPKGLAVLDGNHRMAAYFYCYGYFNLEVDGNIQLNTKETQTYWIGET